MLSASIERRTRVTSTIQVTRKVNPYFEGFTFRVTWIIDLSLLPLSIEADNNWKETNDSFQLISASIERWCRVNSMIQVTQKVNLYFELFSFRVTWIIEFTLPLLSVEAENNWHESCVSFQIISPSIERRRRGNSIIQVTWKVNGYFEVFTFRVTSIIELTLLLLSNEADSNWNEWFLY